MSSLNLGVSDWIAIIGTTVALLSWFFPADKLAQKEGKQRLASLLAIGLAIYALWRLGWLQRVGAWFSSPVAIPLWGLLLGAFILIALTTWAVVAAYNHQGGEEAQLPDHFDYQGLRWIVHDRSVNYVPLCATCLMEMRHEESYGHSGVQWQCRECDYTFRWPGTQGDLLEEIRARYNAQWRKMRQAAYEASREKVEAKP